MSDHSARGSDRVGEGGGEMEREWRRERNGRKVESGGRGEREGERPKRSEGDCCSVEDRGRGRGGRGGVKSCLRRSQEEVRDKDTSINLACQRWRFCHLP